MPKVTEEYKSMRRASLREHALRCFAEKGYQATTIDDIAARSQTSKGAIYGYFSSKEEIFLQVMEENTKKLFSRLEEQFAGMDTASAKLRCLLDYFRKPPGDDDRSMIRVQLEFWLYCSRQDDMNKLLDERYSLYSSFLSRLIEEGQLRGEFRRDVDGGAVAAIFWALRDGTGIQFSLWNNGSVYSDIWRHAEDMLFCYLRPPAAGEV